MSSLGHHELLLKAPARDKELAEEPALVFEGAGHQMHHLAFTFHYAVHLHQPGPDQSRALALCHGFPHHDVHHAGLVLEGEEGDTGSRGGTLPRDDQAACRSKVAMR